MGKIKEKIIKEMKYYKLDHLLIVGFIFLIINRLIPIYLKSQGMITFSQQYKQDCNIASIVLFGLWIAITFFTIRERHYYRLTGRNYTKDHRTYDWSYYQLTNYFSDSEPHLLDTSSFPQKDWKETYGLIFGYYDDRLITLPSNTEGNIAVFGPPGSGKTSGIAIPNAISFDGSVLAVDVKGDIYNYVSQHSDRKILRFCPDHPDALHVSCHFDPFNNIDRMSIADRKLFIENMAIILIPDENSSDGNYFSSRARKYFQGITHLLLYDNPDTSFPDVIHAILNGDPFTWVKKAIASHCIESKELLSSFYGNNAKNVSGVYDALTTAIIQFSNPVLDELLSKSSNSITMQHLDDGYDIYLQIEQQHLKTYAQLFTLILQSFSTAFVTRPDSSTGVKNRPILMLLDEFPQLTFSYSLINENLSTLRSKSIICMLIQQNMSQLEHKYGEIGAKALVGNCNYQVILGSNDIKSSKTYSDTFGTKKCLRVNYSKPTIGQKNETKSIQESREPVFNPTDFGDLPASNSTILYFNGKYLKCSKINCYK
nr:type IV secretory system conjugative DNA transfer family protein [uncultured Anaerostipes sp.]